MLVVVVVVCVDPPFKASFKFKDILLKVFRQKMFFPSNEVFSRGSSDADADVVAEATWH